MRYPSSPCVDGLSTGPPGFGALQWCFSSSCYDTLFVWGNSNKQSGFNQSKILNYNHQYIKELESQIFK